MLIKRSCIRNESSLTNVRAAGPSSQWVFMAQPALKGSVLHSRCGVFLFSARGPFCRLRSAGAFCTGKRCRDAEPPGACSSVQRPETSHPPPSQPTLSLSFPRWHAGFTYVDIFYFWEVFPCVTPKKKKQQPASGITIQTATAALNTELSEAWQDPCSALRGAAGGQIHW